MMEKLSGVSEFRTEVGDSGDNQVSVTDKISIDSSAINSWRRHGLFIWLETEVAERMLRQAKESDGVELAGPGLSSMSPDSRSRREIRKDLRWLW